MKLFAYKWQSTTGLLKPGDVTLAAAPSRPHAAQVVDEIGSVEPSELEPVPMPRGEFFVTFGRSGRGRITVPDGASGASWDECLEQFAWYGVDEAQS